MQNSPSLVKGGIGKDRERREGKVESGENQEEKIKITIVVGERRETTRNEE